ncbi:hypothetical protein VMY22_1 [Bacillus phage VMY22]|uniref:Uncharacterized protein n=1 Tax=Bacillus phage VMY22 TaxID=1734382 RepID=A0A0N9SHQ8_9CAUD|nr:hypothetical protein VMY22_1 [Bacillus phage VMY22]ALH46466.1 hypothetical protein VMY22_1 [Bacillus phage VMY22]
MSDIDKIWIEFLATKGIEMMNRPLVNPLERFRVKKNYGGVTMDVKEQVIHKLKVIGNCNRSIEEIHKNVNIELCQTKHIKQLLIEIEGIVSSKYYKTNHMVGGKRVMKCGTMYVESYERIYGEKKPNYSFRFTSSVDEAVNVDMCDVDSLLQCCPMLEVKEIRMVEM